MRHLGIALVTGAALSLGVSQVAVAAGLPVKARPYTPPPVVVAYNWSGCYIGAHVGGQWADFDHQFNYPGPPPIFTSRSFDDTSFIGGGQIGCNWQPMGAAYVLGIEGDVFWADHDVSGEVFRNGADHYDTRIRLRTQGSIRGRVGFAANNVLFYVTGGFAFGDASVSASIVRDGVGANTTTSDDTLTGWTAGAGIEWGFGPHWSAKAEYRYTDYGSLDMSVPGGAFPAIFFAYTNRTDFTTNDVRVGINYRF